MLGCCVVAVVKNKIPKEDLVLCKPQSMIDEFHNCRFILILIRNLIKDNSVDIRSSEESKFWTRLE